VPGGATCEAEGVELAHGSPFRTGLRVCIPA
jgi:hypothetical protein